MAATKEKLIIIDQIKRGIQKEVEVKKQTIIKEIGEGLTKILDAAIRNSDALDKTLDNYFTKLRISLTAPPSKPKDNLTITLEDSANEKDSEKDTQLEESPTQVDSNNDTVLQESSKDKEDEPGKTEESSAAAKASDDVPSEAVIDKSNESSKSTSDDPSKEQDGIKPLSEEEKEKETIKPTAEQSSAEKDDKKRPADKPVEKLIIKSSKLLTEKSQDTKAKDKPASNESVYDATTGKYGIWVDGEFVIDANKRHEDDPHDGIIKQEIKEEPGMDIMDMPLDMMEDGMMDFNNNMLPVFKDEDFTDENYAGYPGMDNFGMGGEFGSGFNAHMPTDFGSVGGGFGNLHGPSGPSKVYNPSKGLGIAGFAKESQFGATKPKFGHTPSSVQQPRPLLAPAKPLGVGFGKSTEIGIKNDDLPPNDGFEPLTTGKVQRPDLVNPVVATFAQTHEVIHPNDMNDSIRKNWVVYIGTVEGGDKYKCRDCPYTSPGKGNIVLHVKRVHFKIKRDQCDFCPFSASTKQELVGHINTTHQRMTNGDYEFNCTQCSYTTKFRQSLNGHVKYTHQKFVNYGCDQCRFFTYQEEKLDEHITQNHGHPNPLSCMNCTYVTGKQRFLQRHMAACAIRG